MSTLLLNTACPSFEAPRFIRLFDGLDKRDHLPHSDKRKQTKHQKELCTHSELSNGLTERPSLLVHIHTQTAAGQSGRSTRSNRKRVQATQEPGYAGRWGDGRRENRQGIIRHTPIQIRWLVLIERSCFIFLSVKDAKTVVVVVLHVVSWPPFWVAFPPIASGKCPQNDKMARRANRQPHTHL